MFGNSQITGDKVARSLMFKQEDSSQRRRRLLSVISQFLERLKRACSSFSGMPSAGMALKTCTSGEAPAVRYPFASGVSTFLLCLRSCKVAEKNSSALEPQLAGQVQLMCASHSASLHM